MKSLMTLWKVHFLNPIGTPSLRYSPVHNCLLNEISLWNGILIGFSRGCVWNSQSFDVEYDVIRNTKLSSREVQSSIGSVFNRFGLQFTIYIFSAFFIGKKTLMYSPCPSICELIFSRTMRRTEPKFSALLYLYIRWNQSKFGSFPTKRSS